MLSVLLCMEQGRQPVFGYDLQRHEDEMRKQKKDRQEQRQALSAYDQWQRMQGKKAISPHVRESHAREPHRTSPRSLRAERAKRYDEYEAIKRRRALASTIRRSHRTRKRDKATKKTLARQAQNTVRRKKEIQSILSDKAPDDTVGHITSFLGIDRYPQTGGKRRPTKRRKNLRKRLARKRRSHRNRRGRR